MSPATLIMVLLALSSFAYYIGRRRAVAVASAPAGPKRLHSRPTYYGMLTAIWCGLPALLLFGFWLAFQPNIITGLVVADLPEAIRNLPEAKRNLIINDIKNLVEGNIVSDEVNPTMQAAADHYRSLETTGKAALAVVTIAIAIIGMVIVNAKITPALRARILVEKVLQYVLIACSTIAIFTTIGIVLSVLYEAIRFFHVISDYRFPFWTEMESPDGHPRRPGRLIRCFWCGAGFFGDRPDFGHSHAGGGSHRADVGDLPVRICRQ